MPDVAIQPYNPPRVPTEEELMQMRRAVDPERTQMAEVIQGLGNSPEEVQSTADRLDAEMARRTLPQGIPTSGGSAAPAAGPPSPEAQGPPEPNGAEALQTNTASGELGSVDTGGAQAIPTTAQAAATAKPATPPAPQKRQPFKALRQKFQDYYGRTELGQENEKMRLTNVYQNLLNQQLQQGLISAKEGKTREKVLANIADELDQEPANMKLKLDDTSGTVNKDWEDYRAHIRSRVEDMGGDAQAKVEADRMITDYQMHKFNELGMAAYGALSAGDAGTASKQLKQAFQYFPTGTDLQFTRKGDQLYGVQVDEKTRQPVAVHPLTPETLLGYIEKFKDPKAWLTFTSDLATKERGNIIAALDTQLKAGALAQTTRRNDIEQQKADTERAKAQNAGHPGATTPQEYAKAIDTEAQNAELRGEPAPNMADRAAQVSLLEQIVRHQPNLPTSTAAEMVLRGWGDPDLVKKLKAANLLPTTAGTGAMADGGPVKSYGAPMGTETPRAGGSPAVGPADDATRRARIAEATAPQPRPAAPAAPAPQPTQTSGTKDLTIGTAGSRIGGRQRQIDEYVEKAQR